MKIILIEDVKGTGKKDEIKEVKDGFGSFLIKNKKAVMYSNKSKEVLNTQIKTREENEAALVLQCNKMKEQLEKLNLKFKVSVGANGKVFGKISSKQISEELSNMNFNIDKKIIKAEDLNTLGTHIVKIELHKKVSASLKVTLEGGD